MKGGNMAIRKQNQIEGFFSSSQKRKITCRKYKQRHVSALQFKTNAPVLCKRKKGAKKIKKKAYKHLHHSLLHKGVKQSVVVFN